MFRTAHNQPTELTKRTQYLQECGCHTSPWRGMSRAEKVINSSAQRISFHQV